MRFILLMDRSGALLRVNKGGSIVGGGFRAQTLGVGASRLGFERAIFCGARNPRRDTRRGSVVKPLDLLAQFAQALHLVLMLAARLTRSDGDARPQMPETHRRLRLVDVLPAGAARAKSFDLAFAQQVLVGVGQNDSQGWPSLFFYPGIERFQSLFEHRAMCGVGGAAELIRDPRLREPQRFESGIARA